MPEGRTRGTTPLARVVAASVVLVAVVAALLLPAAVGARRAGADEPVPEAYLVADLDTGNVIARLDEHEALPPASTMKLVTALTALELLPTDATVHVSALAARQPAMSINMKEGQDWRFTDALHAMIMASANDAAYAIAETAGGSLDGFAADMGNAARRWGLRDSTLTDPAGLDADGEGFRNGSRISAYDLAVVGRNALAVPEIADAAKLAEYQFTDPTGLARTVPNHDDDWLGAYPGATGLKPGYTEQANRTIVASATRDGRTCLAVVLGIYDIVGWASRLADQCFATPVAAQTSAQGRLPAVRTVTVAAKRAAVAGFPRALGSPTVGAATGASATPGTEVAGKVTTRRDRSPAARSAVRATSRSSSGTDAAAVTAASGGGGGPFTLRNVVIVLVLLAAAFVLLRRRAVKRQRQRRMARQRMLADARRRGVLHVLDPDHSPVSVVPRRDPRPPSRRR